MSEKVYTMFETVETSNVGKLEIPVPINMMYFGIATRRSEEEMGLSGYRAKTGSSPEEIAEISERMNRKLSEKGLDFSKYFSSAASAGVLELKLNSLKKGERGAYTVPIKVIKGETYRELSEDEAKTIKDFLESSCSTFYEYTEKVKSLESAAAQS